MNETLAVNGYINDQNQKFLSFGD